MIKELKTKSFFYKNYEIINFINTNNEQKKLILSWRNDNNVRKWMLNKKIITFKEHCSYIDSLTKRNDKLCFIVKEQNEYLGVVEFDQISKDSSYFGLNSNTKLKRVGIGRILEDISIYIASDLLNIKRILLFVYCSNIQVINLHRKYGFKITSEESINKECVYYMEKVL